MTLNFEIRLLKRGELSTLSDAVFEISLFKPQKVKLTKSFSDYLITDLDMFRTSALDKIKSVEFREPGFSKLLVLMTFQNAKEGDVIEVTFTPDEKKFSDHYWIEGAPSKLSVGFSGSISQDDLKNTENLGTVMSGMNTYGAATLETASLGLSFFSFDPSGNLMKFS